MGLVCCTMISCPLGLCVGSSTSCCCTRTSVPGDMNRLEQKQKRLLIVFLGVLILGFAAFYVPLTFLCARVDQDNWVIWKPDGECWSEDGSMPGAYLGFVAGLVMGFGFMGFVTTFFIFLILVIRRCCCGGQKKTQKELEEDEVDENDYDGDLSGYDSMP